ncbi:hypothetical protein ACH5RR_037601 [Cinchona calisaya]|uniref:F-box domain-containing protein n=1 Tax=Cinchona calisaya TaxID=153742 RepID=A0ABD2Y9Q8_9GENT
MLPEPILQHILSFVEVKDAIRTSVLSKILNNAFATLQCLNFGDGSIFPVAKRNENEKVVFLKISELLNAVESMILRRQEQNVGVQRFCLRLSHSFKLLDLTSYIARLMKALIACNIKKLVFKVGTYHCRPWYTLPEALYACNSLSTLELGGFKLEWPPNGGTIKLSSLRELRLYKAHVDDQLLEHLIMSCPELEFLRVDYCFGFYCLQILGLLKLKEISTYNCCEEFNKIKIQAPNLEYLSHHGLGRLSVVDVTSCRSLRLFLPKELRENLWPPLYDIKHLTVIPYDGVNKSMVLDLLDSLLWMAPCLDTLSLFLSCHDKTIKFTHETSVSDEGVPCCTSVPFKCWRHTLKKVKFENFEDVEDQWKLKNYFVGNAKVLESIDGLTECDT